MTVPDTDGPAEDTAAAELDELVETWLESKAGGSPNTEKAYRSDMKAWRAFCDQRGVDVLRAKKTDVEAWHRHLAATPTGRTGKPPAQATLARKVASVASFYQLLVDDDIIDAVPVRSSTRPRAPKHSTTVGLSPAETVLLRTAASAAGPLEQAVILILLDLGIRVTELTGLDVGSYRWKQDRRTLVVIRKGDEEQELPCGNDVVAAVDEWLDVLADRVGMPVDRLDPDAILFPNVAGGRYTQRSLMRLVRSLARQAGISSWNRLSPHSLRHTAATNMLAAGVQIHIVQELLGHAHVSTTQRYDRDRGSFDRSVSGQDALAAFLAHTAGQVRTAA